MSLAETIAHLVELYTTDAVLRRIGPALALNFMAPDGTEGAVHGGAGAVVLQRVGVGTPEESVRVQLLDADGGMHEWRADKPTELRPEDTPRTPGKRWKDHLAERLATAVADNDPADVE